MMHIPQLPSESLLDVLDRMRGLRVLVVGDVMLDHYVWGEVSRISPEAPVPVVKVRNETFTLGGAANVALNLAALGVNTRLLSTWGTDNAGTKLASLLANQHIEFMWSPLRNHIQTIVKKRVIARTQQLCRIDYEGPMRMYAEAFPRMSECLSEAIDQCDAVIVSDYAKGFVSQELVDELVLQASSRMIPVAVDPKPTRKINFHQPWLLTPNRHESIVLADIVEGDHGESLPIEEVCSRIHALMSPRLLIVTLGAEGMVISSANEELVRLPTVAKEVFDVSGAGDTVIATLVAASIAGADCISAAKIANVAAGCVVAHVGTVPIDPVELKNRLSKNSIDV